MIISFSGLDGSGKTTHSALTSKYLNDHHVKTINLHMQKFSIFGKLSKALAKISPKAEERIKCLEYSQEKKEKRIIKYLRKTTYLVDILRFYIVELLNKNKVIICDRYFYDLLIQSCYFNLFGHNFSKFYIKIIPKSQLPFFLNTTVNIAMKRATKNPLLEDKFFFKKKEKLYSELDVNFIVINSGTIKERQKNIEKIIKEKILNFM